MTELNLRPASTADAGAISEIARNAYAKYVGRMGRRPTPMDTDYVAEIIEQAAFVHEAGGEVLAYIIMEYEDEVLFLRNLAVSPALQGQGLGRQLLDFAEAHARENGFDKIRLTVNEAMTENRLMYDARGYRETHREQVEADYRLYMLKDLA